MNVPKSIAWVVVHSILWDLFKPHCFFLPLRPNLVAFRSYPAQQQRDQCRQPWTSSYPNYWTVIFAVISAEFDSKWETLHRGVKKHQTFV
eukprot:5815111-Amphidinium_carterae.1